MAVIIVIFFMRKMNYRQKQTEAPHTYKKKRFKTLVSKRPRVEIPRLERGLSEPKSLVLPLHHTSIQLSKDRIIFLYHQT